MTEENNVEDAYVITDALPGASATEEDQGPPQVEVTMDGPKIQFGIAILVDDKGNMYLERNPRAFNLPVEREATMIEVRRYAADVVMDIQAQAAGEYSLANWKRAQEEAAAPAPETPATEE